MSNKAIIIKSPERFKIDSELEKDVYFNELVRDAKKIVENGRLFGFKIDIDNPRDVIAAVYAMYLNVDQMITVYERELGYLMDV